MTPNAHTLSRTLLVLALAASGCQDASNNNEVASAEAPKAAAPPSVSLPAETPKTETPAPEKPVAAEPKTAEAKPDSASTEIKLEPVRFDEFLSRVAANKNVKYTIVDAWATWCVPCRENFPHLVEMNRKYADKGLGVISLSFDDPTNAKNIEEAKKFLNEKKAVFPNFLLDEADGVGFEKLDINTIPAVFLYGSDGKLLKKFTLDDPNNQFTYEDVEKTVVALLDGKPLPKDEAAAKPKN